MSFSATRCRDFRISANDFSSTESPSFFSSRWVSAASTSLAWERSAVTVGATERSLFPVAMFSSSAEMMVRTSSMVATTFESLSLSEPRSSSRISPRPKRATCSNSRTLGSMSCGRARSMKALFAAPLGFCARPATMSSRLTTTPRAPVQETMRSASAISSAMMRGVSSRARPPTSATRRSALSSVRLSTVMWATPPCAVRTRRGRTWLRHR